MRLVQATLLFLVAGALAVVTVERTGASATIVTPPPTAADAPAPMLVNDLPEFDAPPVTALDLTAFLTPASCAGTHAPGDFIETLGDRSYRLHVPPAYTHNAPVPLVVNFSGYGRSAAEQEDYSGLVPLANREGFVLVTPEGSGSPKGWDIVGVYDEDGVDDVAFTKALVGQIENELCIDQARVFAIGMSNGAEMASQVACDLPQVFAAVAAVSGVVNQGCRTPVPLIAFHGTADQNVPFDWAPVATAAWARTNGCTGPADSTMVAAHVERRAYRGCGANSVELYVVTGGGHTWPGAADGGGVGPTNHEISASEIAWQFFAGHPRAS